MPELPEVETIRRILGPQLKGRVIGSCRIGNDSVIAHPSAALFTDNIRGKTICGTGRRGKFLLIDLEGGGCIIIHLRMTGSLIVAPKGYPEERHTHVLIALDDGTELRFSDTRRFGRLWFIDKNETDGYTGIDRLGPEPFDGRLTASYLHDKLGRSTRPIKQCLMDQSVIAGIGNIYADEILFAASIDPRRQARTLRRDEWKALATMIPERLSFFIERNMISAEEYLETRGKEYRNTPFLQVYGHKGEPCPRCGRPLMHSVVGGRGCTFCSACQR